MQELDLLLPKVCEALVLVTQCLTTIMLRAEASADMDLGPSQSDDVAAHTSLRPVSVVSDMFLRQNLVENLVGEHSP